MQYKSTVFLWLVVGILSSFVAISTGAVSGDQVIQFTQKSDNTLSFSADLEGIVQQSLQTIINEDAELLSCGTGITYEYNKPILPFISKIIIVPPQAAVRLNIEAENIRVVRLNSSPRICKDPEVRTVNHVDNYDFYPEKSAEISTPFIIRGVRMVKLTLNPVRYQRSTNSYIFCDNISAELEFTDDEPVNPVENADRQHTSQEFLKFLDQYAENSRIIRRDHVDDLGNKGDHYLVVTHESCLQYAAPLIEWKRKTGHKIDILSIPNNISRIPDEIKPLIQERYDAYIDAGLDPFDQLLLIGDRSNYGWGVVGPWQLEAERGETIWGDAFHADYKYALLEGDDIYPDVGFSRFCAGNQGTMELFVGRTLLYEAEPFIEETEWFTRGGVYSQHWGNDPEDHTWHISLHSNVRWARELLKSNGFDDVRFYEDYDYDQGGARVGPWVRDLINERTNLLLGRAETLYWQQIFTGVEVNVVFPVRLVLSGHGEWTAWTMLRSGDGDNLRGPVVSTCNWGGPPTITNSASWLELVNAVVQRGMSYGWGRIVTIAQVEKYFPNFEFGEGWHAYTHIRTDMDFYGDPGLRVWMGVPRQLNVEFPEVIDENATVIEAIVTDPEDDSPVEGVLVSLYDPVDIPDFADAEYADYSEMRLNLKRTSANGSVQFMANEDFEFRPESTIQLTAFGEGICPVFGEIEVGNPEFIVGSRITLTEVLGNEDGDYNPGELWSATIRITNTGEERLEGGTVVFYTDSPYLTIISEFGSANFPDLGIGSSTEFRGLFELQFAENCPDAESHPSTKPVLSLEIRNDDGSMKTAHQFAPVAPHLNLNEIVGGNVIPIDDQNYQLDIVLENDGRFDLEGVNAELSSLESWINVVESGSTYPMIEAGANSGLSGEPFLIMANSLIIPGVICDMLMVLSRDETVIDSIHFTLQVGESIEEGPRKPDKYGYICLDDTDSDWEIAPDYEWIEISLRDDDRDYDGIRIDELTPNTPYDVGDVTPIELPFQLRFYGETYDTISVTTNGFICPGNQDITNPQNWPLDRAMGGGAGMIALFWDWLMMDNQSGVYYYHNEEEHYVIIEWYRFKQYPQGETDLTFQVIIYHPLAYLNETGDSNILMQYRSIENLEGVNEIEDNIPFASVGISSPDGLSGISYTYGGDYPQTSAPLANRRAIKFTTSMWEEYQEPPVILGVVYGRVRNVETRAGIAGVNIEMSSGEVTQTDDDGFYRIPDIPVDSIFDISAGHESYRDTTLFGLQIGDEDSLRVIFELQEILSINQGDNAEFYSGFELISIYPQPFNNIATVKFFIEDAGKVNFSIFDLNGRELESLTKTYSTSGIKKMKLESSSIVAGLYFLQVDTKFGSISRKIVYMK